LFFHCVAWGLPAIAVTICLCATVCPQSILHFLPPPAPPRSFLTALHLLADLRCTAGDLLLLRRQK
jgi:hypothetical protein